MCRRKDSSCTYKPVTTLILTIEYINNLTISTPNLLSRLDLDRARAVSRSDTHLQELFRDPWDTYTSQSVRHRPAIIIIQEPRFLIIS